MNTVRIAIVDDHVLFRKGLVSLISAQEGFEIVLEASNGQEFLQRIGSLEIDVTLMDIEMPELDGIEATRLLREKAPDIKVVMLSAYEQKSMILHAIDNGACGYLHKSSDPQEFSRAIKTVMELGYYFPQEVSHMLLKGIVKQEQFDGSFNAMITLTDREKEVLTLICQELTSAEIGEKLFLSQRTVETYRRNLMEKIGAKNTVGLVLYALKSKLVEL